MHAIGDNYIFLSRNEEIVTVATEHRDAPSIDPFYMTLVSDDQDCTHLEIIDRGNKDDSSQSLRKDPRDRVLQYLENIDEPVSASILRSKINMNNQVLCDILNNLQNEGIISRTRKGVALMKNVTPMTSLESDDSLEPFLS